MLGGGGGAPCRARPRGSKPPDPGKETSGESPPARAAPRGGGARGAPDPASFRRRWARLAGFGGASARASAGRCPATAMCGHGEGALAWGCAARVHARAAGAEEVRRWGLTSCAPAGVAGLCSLLACGGEGSRSGGGDGLRRRLRSDECAVEVE